MSRKIVQIIEGLETSDGAGVKLRRIIGGPDLNMLDPFLLFDEFGSDDPSDYIGGFPPHPHRGCLLYTSPSPRDRTRSRMPSSA